jgi:predicted component of type VI protein secretion system
MAKAVLTFALYADNALQRRETVTQDIVKVGRDPRSHLRVDDEQASRMHSVIEVAGPDDITLIDLGNEPGTMVNGARVTKCKLHVGDQIRVGGTIMVLEHAEAVVPEAPASVPGISAAMAMAPVTTATIAGTGPMMPQPPAPAPAMRTAVMPQQGYPSQPAQNPFAPAASALSS